MLWGSRNPSCASRQRRRGLRPERRGRVKIGDQVTVGDPGTSAFMLRGVSHAWKNAGAEAGRVLFVYTPARASGLLEERQRTNRTVGSIAKGEVAELGQRHGWKIWGRRR